MQAIESAFNPRLRDAVGDLALVPRDERVVGPGAGYIMAAFTHVSPDGSRFSNGTYGVFYAAQREATAIAETRYHRERFMRATKQARCELDMRVLERDGHTRRCTTCAACAPSCPTSIAPTTTPRRNCSAARFAPAGRTVWCTTRFGTTEGNASACFVRVLCRSAATAKHLRYVWDGSAGSVPTYSR